MAEDALLVEAEVRAHLGDRICGVAEDLVLLPRPESRSQGLREKLEQSEEPCFVC